MKERLEGARRKLAQYLADGGTVGSHKYINLITIIRGYMQLLTDG